MSKCNIKSFCPLIVIHGNSFEYHCTRSTSPSVCRRIIYIGLTKGENAFSRKIANLPVNSRIFHSLMQLEFQNFWKPNKVFVAKNVTKVAKLAKTVANLATLPLMTRIFHSYA